MLRRFFKGVYHAYFLWLIFLMVEVFYFGAALSDGLSLPFWELAEGAYLPPFVGVSVAVLLSLFAALSGMLRWVVPPKANGDLERVKGSDVTLFYLLGGLFSAFAAAKVIMLSPPESGYLILVMIALPIASFIFAQIFVKAHIQEGWQVKAESLRKVYVERTLLESGMDRKLVEAYMATSPSYYQLGVMVRYLSDLGLTRKRMLHLKKEIQQAQKDLKDSAEREKSLLASINSEL